jgi:hypothetical protein
VVLVATPVAYRLHARSMHVVETRTWWWPTAWMVLPLLACIVGAVLVFAPSALRRPARRRAGTAARAPARRDGESAA